MFLWTASSWGKLKANECGPRALETQNCHLQWAKMKVHIRGDKVNSHNGVHRSLVDFPVAGESVEWKKVRLRKLAGDLFIEAEVWGNPDETTKVSDLNWVVYKYDGVEPEIKVNRKIQRRKPKESKKSLSTYELMDKPQGHKLFVKSKKAYWKAGFEQGEVK